MAARITQGVTEALTFEIGVAHITQGVIEVAVGLGIDCASPPAGVVGVAYSHTFPAGGGDAPYTFAITAGSLPPGLSLNASTGVVSGTPTTLGLRVFTIQVTDALTATDAVQCSIRISGGLSIHLYGYKRFKNRPPCAPDGLVELPDVPPPRRVL